MCPFIFFPIFPAYSQWRPERGTNVPESIAVCDRLEKVCPGAQPFSGTWYRMEFLKRSAITNPTGFRYNELTRCLEPMLLWSFHTRVSLLDWDEQQVDGFLSFYCDPPVGCTAVSVRNRFLEDYSAPFKDWAINPDWRLFRRTPDGNGTLKPVTRDAFLRLVFHVKHFFDFYLSSTGSPHANPANEVSSASRNLNWSKSSVVFTERQLDWLLTDALTSRVHSRQALQMMMYLGFARYTNLTAKQVVGSPSAQFTLDRLRRETDGGWSLSASSSGVSNSWLRLPAPMSPLIERYLQSRQVDLIRALPNLPLFPQLSDVEGYKPDSVSTYVKRIRELVADAALADDDPGIAASADCFRKLTFSMVRRSTRLASLDAGAMENILKTGSAPFSTYVCGASIDSSFSQSSRHPSTTAPP
ncbi:hypothetical protein PS676_05358 [Pseudomonas fluorescens]|nr:hypothetical protein PS676_05358 [Pseudomonas fluorescens]